MSVELNPSRFTRCLENLKSTVEQWQPTRRAYYASAGVFAAIHAGDLFSTWFALQINNYATEANPMNNTILEHAGWPGAIAFSAVQLGIITTSVHIADRNSKRFGYSNYYKLGTLIYRAGGILTAGIIANNMLLAINS